MVGTVIRRLLFPPRSQASSVKRGVSQCATTSACAGTRSEPQRGADWDHRRASGMDGLDDLAAVDALEVDGRDAEVAVSELTLDDDQCRGWLQRVPCPRQPDRRKDAQDSTRRRHRGALGLLAATASALPPEHFTAEPPTR